MENKLSITSPEFDEMRKAFDKTLAKAVARMLYTKKKGSVINLKVTLSHYGNEWRGDVYMQPEVTYEIILELKDRQKTFDGATEFDCELEYDENGEVTLLRVPAAQTSLYGEVG